MDFLSKLTLDGFYAHKKMWHLNLWYLTLSRLAQINGLIQKINSTLKHSPSVAHQSLHNRFSSAYFWQSMETHESFAQAKEIWQNVHHVIYVEAETLVWFIDYAFPILIEYLSCALKDCDLLNKNAQESMWQKYLPGFSAYLEGIAQLIEKLSALAINLNKLKNQTSHATKLKIEQNNDLLKLIARALDMPCDFESTEQVNTNTLIFLKQTHPNSHLKIRKIQLDKNPPLISPFEAKNNWQTLSLRLRDLKIKYRLTTPHLNSSSHTWFSALNNFNWPTVYQAKIYLIQKGLKYATVPLLMGLFLIGWLSVSFFGIGIALWMSYPLLTKLTTNLLAQCERLDHILQSYSEAYFRDFLVERAEYIETIERSALWRKNRLAPGCHQLNSLDPHLILGVYEDFNVSIQQKIKDLSDIRPYFWQIWRQESAELIDLLIAELTQEQTHLLTQIQLYTTDIAHRTNQSFFLEKTHSLEKITLFITNFSPSSIAFLNQENCAIEHFFACLCENSRAALLLRRPLISPSHFATHCCDVVAINTLLAQITHQIKNPDKLQVILALTHLLKQEIMMSVDQLENHLAQIATPNYCAQTLKKAIQHYLFSTFNTQQILVQNFFTASQHKTLSTWLMTKKNDIQKAQQYVQLFLELPDYQDWGSLPEVFFGLSAKTFRNYLILLKLNDDSKLIHQLQNKIIALSPNYSGAPSALNECLSVLWQENCPIELEERVIEARFGWTLDKISVDNNLMPLDAFIQELTDVLPSADHAHRLSRALINHPQFYLPWHVHTQKAVVQLEANGLMLPVAKAAYSQKGLQQWLQCT